MRSWLRSDLRILAYHRVVTVDDPRVFDFDLDLISTSADRFREQMLLLKKRFHPMLLGQALAAADAGESVPANTVVVTFDDGYDDNYRIAYPILRELGVPATFFVSTGHIDSGRPFAYDWLVHMILRTTAPRLELPELNVQASIPDSRPARRRLAARILRDMKAFDDTDQRAAIQRLEREWNMPRGVRVRDCCPMTWDQLREMHAAGFEIGSHGVHHRELAKLTQAELQAELVDSRATLQRELGVTTHLIAYPVGGDQAFDERVMQAAKGAGYDAACSYIFGTNSWSKLNRYALYRLPVEREMGLGWFAAMLTLPGLMGYPTVSRGAESDDEGRACSS
jgi:peptidoglycan/xylan/chitin deacetylase (PgdA/CDA1 family)